MRTEVAKIFTNLFQTSSPDVSNEALQQLVNKYPYFAAAQFALAADLKKEDSYHSLSQLQKTALFFSNTKWFEYLLSDETDFNELNFNKEENKTVEEVDEEISNSKISSVLSSQLNEIKKPVDEDAKLDFEKETPQYTIDYFASQGIVFDPSKFNGDKLSRQLMSFTDWLKQMKKVNSQLSPTTISADVEHAIQKIAENSNQTKEVLTESMAEVFVKQGSIDKARQLYSKLSFLYPEKSAYFATKIQELNTK